MNLTSRRMWWRGRASWTRLHCVICCELATLHGVSTKLHTVCFCNKCIGVDTKAAARQSPYCIKKQNKHKIWRKKRFSIRRMEFLHRALWHVAMESWQWIHQVAAPCNVIRGWYAIEFAQTSAIVEFYIWFRPYHRSRHVILHQSTKFYPNRTTLGRKNDVMSIFKMADLSHLGF